MKKAARVDGEKWCGDHIVNEYFSHPLMRLALWLGLIVDVDPIGDMPGAVSVLRVSRYFA